jgi:hypothetical protein
MKRIILLLFSIFFIIAGNLYAQIVLIRPNASVGYYKSDDMKGLSYDYGLKVLLTASKTKRYGIMIDSLNVIHDENSKISYLTVGLFIEQIVFKYFNMGIGTVGYINLTEPGENPFGLYTHLGFEYPFAGHFNILAAYQSDFVFRHNFAMNSAFMLGIGLQL